MIAAKKPKNEKPRLASLRALNLLDTLPESDFDEIVFLASQICETPVAMISLVDGDRQWFKSKVGTTAVETPRDVAFCAHAILGDSVFEVPDATQDDRFFDNPLVTGESKVQFYAGAPLLSPEGYAIGALCVIDTKPRKLDAGKIRSLKALSNQVTRLFKLRQQLEQSDQLAKSIEFKVKAADSIAEGIVLQDTSGAIIDFNPAALKVLGLSADQLKGKTSLDPSWKAVKEDGSDFPGADHPAMACLRTGAAQINVIMGIRNLGSETRWLRVNAVPLFDFKTQKVSHCACSFADVTDQINLQKKLDFNREQLGFILDGIPNLVALWNVDEIYLSANAAYARFFKKDPSQLKGCSMREIVGQDLYEKNKPFIKRVLAGERVTFERTIKLHDGSTLHTLASYIPNFNDGKVVSFLATILDVTELKKLEAEQKVLESRLFESAKLSALGEMSSGVAHEINNPLAIIQGRVDSTIRKVKSGELEVENLLNDLETIRKTSVRIAKIVNAMRLYSRDAEGDPFECANLTDIVSDTLELCRERFAKNGVEIRLECDLHLLVSCRTAQISQVLMNLLMNSYDAIQTLSQKWIKIRAVNEQGTAKVSVIDSGAGIDPAIVEKMMNPFFTTKPVGQGTGLGLSISKGLMEIHGGQLSYDGTRPNTTFTLSLPAVAEGER